MLQGKRIKNEKSRLALTRCLASPGPELVVCDEGHILRNPKSGVRLYPDMHTVHAAAVAAAAACKQIEHVGIATLVSSADLNVLYWRLDWG